MFIEDKFSYIQIIYDFKSLDFSYKIFKKMSAKYGATNNDDIVVNGSKATIYKEIDVR